MGIVKVSDISIGDTVYHKLFTHFGKGEVIAISPADGMERLFEKRGGPRRIVVKFAAHDDATRCWPTVLRSTPNTKRMREMIEMYRQRNVTAYEENGRLMIDRSSEPTTTSDGEKGAEG